MEVEEVSTGILRIFKLYRESDTRVAKPTTGKNKDEVTADDKIVLLRDRPIKFALQGFKYVDPVSSSVNSPIDFSIKSGWKEIIDAVDVHYDIDNFGVFSFPVLDAPAMTIARATDAISVNGAD